MKSWSSRIVDGLRIVVILTVISLGLAVVTHAATGTQALTGTPQAIAQLTVTPTANGSFLVTTQGLRATLTPNWNGKDGVSSPEYASSFIVCLTTAVGACTDPDAETFTAIPQFINVNVDLHPIKMFPAQANKPSTFYVVAYLVAPATGSVTISSGVPMVAQFLPGPLQ